VGCQPFVVSFVGPSGVGKTTLIEQLIPLLRVRGCKVGTVKHAPHGHDVDKTGSDSWRHRMAGADAVLLAGASGAVLFLPPHTDASSTIGAHHQPSEPAPLLQLAELVNTHLKDLDVVLAEGYAPLFDALIAVHRTGVRPKAGSLQPTPWFTVTDRPTGPGDYDFRQLDDISARIMERVDNCID
jgi:molybdopterin-guanine dinucleotide biosynthesis protein B